MSPYDPKQKRAHSPTVEEGPAPVDDLLAPTPPSSPAVTPMATTAPSRHSPTPVPVSSGPDPRMIALAAGAAVVVLVAWRWRRR